MTRATPNRRPGTPRALMNARRHWHPIIIAGLVECRRCHQPIRPGQPWDLGHPTDQPYTSGNRDRDLAPEHRTCNRSGLTVDQTPTFGW